MRRFRLALIGVLLGGSIPQIAMARCDVSLDAPGQVRFQGGGGTGYEAFDASRHETEFVLTVSNSGTAVCNGLISLQRAVSTTIGLAGPAGQTLAYVVAPPGSLSTIVDNQFDAGRPPNAIAVTVPPGESRIQRLSLTVAPQQVVPSGDYGDTVLVRLIDSSDLELSAERSLQLTSNVRSTMSILLFASSFSGSSTAGTRNYRMDFGALQAGEQSSVTVLVQANDEYALRFSSANRGAMTHSTLGSSQSIPYTATIGGRELNLSTGETIFSVASSTSLSGASQQLNVRIGEVGPARAGNYQDELTITVLPTG